MNTQVPGYIKDSVERFTAYSAYKRFLSYIDVQTPYYISE